MSKWRVSSLTASQRPLLVMYLMNDAWSISLPTSVIEPILCALGNAFSLSVVMRRQSM